MSGQTYANTTNYAGRFAETNQWIFHIRPTKRGYIATAIPRKHAIMRIENDGTRKWYYDPKDAGPTVGPFLTESTALTQCGARLK